MTQTAERSYTVKTLADRLQLSEVTIRRGIRTGKIPHRRHGRAIRFSEEDVQAYLRSVRVGGQS